MRNTSSTTTPISRAMCRSSIDRYNPFHIEGGDILNLNDKVLAVGISQRTEPDAIDMIARNIFASEESHHRDHSGLQHPQQPRVHASGHRVHPD